VAATREELIFVKNGNLYATKIEYISFKPMRIENVPKNAVVCRFIGDVVMFEENGKFGMLNLKVEFLL
jgi:hypothetical protein